MKATCIRSFLLALALPFAAGAFAQGGWPSRPITLVVPFAAGGATDTAARIIAKKLTENLGQSVIVENVAGAGGNIAHQQVAAAPPDGYKILLGSVGPLAVAKHLTKLNFDPEKDLAPITMAVVFSNVLVVHPGVPVKSLAEFVAMAKKDPGKYEYGSTGVGGAAHLAGELFKQRAGVDLTHVPYKGGGAAMPDILGGRITSYWATPATSLQHIQAGRLKPLATTGLTRSPQLPEVPTVAESGYPGFEATNWYAFVAPAKTPPEILDRWNKELVKILNDADVRAELSKHGLEPKPGTREELAAYIRRESETWSKVIKQAGIKAD